MPALRNQSNYCTTLQTTFFLLLAANAAFAQTTTRWIQNDKTNPLQQFTVASGRQSHPVFVDIDGDGDLDCFSGEFAWNANKIVSSRISFYRNDGDSRHPFFKEINGTQNPLSSVAVPGFLIPRFADIDNDGDEDCFIATDNGAVILYKNAGIVKQAKFEKQSAAFNPLSNVKLSGIAINQFLLADADRDGDIDCLLTDQDGTSFYYNNKGSASLAKFEAASETNNPFAFVSRVNNSNISFYDCNNDGSSDIIINAAAYLNQYGHFAKASGISFPDNDDAIAPSLADLNADGTAEMISGTADGKFVYNTPDIAHTNAVLSITVSPNPTTKNFTASIPFSPEKRTLQIVNESGKIVGTQTISNSQYIFGDNFTPGVYIVKLYSGSNKIAEQKIVKL